MTKELLKKLEILKHKPIQNNLIKLLWHSNYYDGMLSGMLLYENKKYWFSCFDDIFDYPEVRKECNEKEIHPSEIYGWYRRFSVHELSTEQIEDQEYWHGLFRKHVGTHTDYDEFGKRSFDGVRPREGIDLFYKPFRDRFPDYNELEKSLSSGKIVGWFYE